MSRGLVRQKVPESLPVSICRSETHNKDWTSASGDEQESEPEHLRNRWPSCALLGRNLGKHVAQELKRRVFLPALLQPCLRIRDFGMAAQASQDPHPRLGQVGHIPPFFSEPRSRAGHMRLDGAAHVLGLHLCEGPHRARPVVPLWFSVHSGNPYFL